MATQIAPTEERQTNLPALTPEGERFNLRQRQARMFAMSPLVPEHLRKGSQEQAIANCWIALTLAEAMGEVPLIVMQNIHVVNGKAGFASQYMIARANSSGVFKGRIDWRIDHSDPNNLSVTAYAYLRETGQEVSVTCDMKMAKAEGWTKNPKYGTMPEVMLRYRSAAFLVRFYAPDVMLGYQTAEEVDDVVASATTVQPPLNARMLLEQASDGTGDETDQPSAGPDDEADPGTNDAANSQGGNITENITADRPGTLGEQLGLDDAPAGSAKVQELKAALATAKDADAVEAAVAEYEKHKAALDEEMQSSVQIAISQARAKAKAGEGVE